MCVSSIKKLGIGLNKITFSLGVPIEHGAGFLLNNRNRLNIAQYSIKILSNVFNIAQYSTIY